MESALNEIRKKEIESLTYSPTDRQDLRAGKDLLPPTVYHLFGTLDVSPTYAVSREDLLEWIYAMESQPRPKNLFDELRQNLPPDPRGAIFRLAPVVPPATRREKALRNPRLVRIPRRQPNGRKSRPRLSAPLQQTDQTPRRRRDEVCRRAVDALDQKPPDTHWARVVTSPA